MEPFPIKIYEYVFAFVCIINLLLVRDKYKSELFLRSRKFFKFKNTPGSVLLAVVSLKRRKKR